MGPYTMVYKTYVGDYNKTAERIRGVMQELSGSKLEIKSTFCIFLDPPGSASKDLQRSEIGIILSDRDSELNEINKSEFSIKEFPKQECAVAEFPFRHSFSPWIGVAKVYPAMHDFLRKKNRDIKSTYSLEIYDQNEITYIIPRNQ